MPRTALIAILLPLLAPQAAHARAADALDPLYERIAADLRAAKPLVVTVHVALCDNDTIACGGRALGDGDTPRHNLYWGGAAGFTATFRLARGYRRIFRDTGDGTIVVERVVYRRRVAPSAAWRRRGVTRPFEIVVVGLAYRGEHIGRAMRGFIHALHRERSTRLKLPNGRAIALDGAGHVVGYAGHNHLMDAVDFEWPRWRRRAPIGYFALACMTAPYLARHLAHQEAHGLLLTRVLMYPGAFTIVGLLEGLAAGLPQEQVFSRGADAYARAQRRPSKQIRAVFTHDAQARYRRRYLGQR